MTRPADVRWDDRGLAPAIIQDAATGRVLMLGWMNADALSRTLAIGEVHFWSRSRNALWRKGETSGNVLRLRSLALDCDRDAILVRADPTGPVCHAGTTSCFDDGDSGEGLGTTLAELMRIVHRRAVDRPEGSYTSRLLDAGVMRVAQKVGEEGVEVALAATAGSDESVVNETADLLYHLLVLLESRGLPAERIGEELRRRFPVSPPGAPSGPPSG